MSNIKLGPTAYVMLGMLALRGPSTPYQLERAVGRSVGHFWRFPRSQFYDEPARLAEAGLLEEEREDGGRRRRTYTITEAGRAELGEWLSGPAERPFEIRDVAQLKLFFGELGGRDHIVALAREQVRLNRERLSAFEAIGERVADRPDIPARVAPLELGLRITRATIAFWEEVAADPPAAD